METAKVDLLAELRERFGLAQFRPAQEQVIRGILDGHDTLVVMPTGSGKSLLYQLAALLLPGVTLVVSPLIALMHDQVDSLVARDIAVRLINSTQSKTEATQAIDDVRAGKVKLLYVTPERFKNKQFLKQLRAIDVSLFVVDEAHSIAEWGHSFRPAYLQLANAITQLRQPTILALTATATAWVQRDIIERLHMRDPQTVVRGTDRPNLFFEVRRVEQETDDQRVLRDLLGVDASNQDDATQPWQPELRQAMQGCGIVYTATTRAARETAEWLNAWGIRADYYHGQRKKADRERVQHAFMNGDVQVIVATNAFGLGVDKSDVRFVIHRDVPASLEAYYQEAGRAGRDGEFARCTIIYRPADLGRATFLAGNGRLTREEVEQAYSGFRASETTTIDDLAAQTGLNQTDLTRLLAIMKQQRIISERKGQIRVLKPDWRPDDIPLEDEEHRQSYERSRVEMMRGYVETSDCRRRFLLNYFGEEPATPICNTCDNDLQEANGQRVQISAPEQIDSPFTVGMRVQHEQWGGGIVQRMTEDSLTVLFDEVGYKTLATDVVQEQGLLQIA